MTPAGLFWRCRAAVFDLDGTLVDTLDGLHVALNEALAAFDAPPVDLPGVRQAMHGGFEATVRSLAGRGPAAQQHAPGILRAYRANYRRVMLQRSRPYPSVQDVLEQQKQRGCRLAVCTNRDESLAEELLDGLGLRPWFDAVVGLREGVEAKPHPRMLHNVLQALAVSPSSALMVGDSQADVACARAAGVPCLVFDGGYGAEGLQDVPGVGRFASYPALLRSRQHDGVRT